MRTHTEIQGLEQLPALVQQQRRLLAGQLRVEREKRELQDQIDRLLADVGVDVVTCTLHLGTFEVRRAVARDGHRYASVTPVKE